ncbi:RNA-binding protein 12-like [Dorcoceras hygrometricum]|uniref:RNA-binding protein 12-like n=1 Tax=Dorcoceras hygrometricum TaxID=472368 RepID=A0A2Z7DHT0_9LAMI|nr:RNA-binding protein 12-like [Dorcoceras hygrometricum]
MSYYNQNQPPVGVPPPQGDRSHYLIFDYYLCLVEVFESDCIIYRIPSRGVPERCLSSSRLPAARLPTAAGLPTPGVSATVRTSVRCAASSKAVWWYRVHGRMLGCSLLLLSAGCMLLKTKEGTLENGYLFSIDLPCFDACHLCL